MTLRELAADAGLEIGACASRPDLEDEQYAERLGSEFNRLSLENDLKWGPVHPENDEYTFQAADDLVGFAEDHDMAVTGHALAWHIQNPAWLEEQSWEEERLAAVLQDHIHTVTERYSDRIDTWDVVNEAVNDDGELRETLWLEGMGERYIADAFRWARDQTDASLFYNEYGLPYNEAKQDRVYRLLDELLEQGVPVDGIGLQLHCVGVHPGPEQLRQTIERFQELGLTVRVSELDIAYRKADQPDDLEKAHAAAYRETVQACLDAGVDSITLWGVLDDHSWITTWRDYPDRYTQQPLLFDGDGRKKQAYEAVASVLRSADRGEF